MSFAQQKRFPTVGRQPDRGDGKRFEKGKSNFKHFVAGYKGVEEIGC